MYQIIKSKNDIMYVISSFSKSSCLFILLSLTSIWKTLPKSSSKIRNGLLLFVNKYSCFAFLVLCKFF